MCRTRVVVFDQADGGLSKKLHQSYRRNGARELRILQVITDTDRRGAQVFASDLGLELAANGEDVSTVALVLGDRKDLLDVPFLGRYRRGPVTLCRLRREMRAHDVIIAHGSATGLATVLAGFGLKKMLVYRQISDSRFWAPSRFRRIRVRWMLRGVSTIVALSETSKIDLIEYIGVPPNKIEVIANGVSPSLFRPGSDEERADARSFLGLDQNSFVVSYVGALVAEKGVDLVIEACSVLQDAELLIVGDGPERDALSELSHSYDLAVHFIGGLTDVSCAYHASDVTALMSKGGDSMPATLIEAAFCGTPAITTNVGATEEIVIDQVSGFVLDQPSVSDAVRGLEILRKDVLLRQEMGRSAREHCLRNFSIRIIAGQWKRLIDSHLSNHS